MAGEPWSPTLADVARHIPTRTRDRQTPGSDRLLGTFTAHTTPTSEQAQAVIDSVVGVLVATVGQLPANDDVRVAARQAVEWRAAADIELAYPNRDADVAVYTQLNARAEAAWAAFSTVLVANSAGTVDTQLVYSFPPGPPWGDLSPGSGVEALPHGYPWNYDPYRRGFYG